MMEIKEHVDNNSRQINGISKKLKEQGNKLINVEAKINQDKGERIQVCEDLKEHNKEIVNYIEEKIKIENATGHNMITNYRKIEKGAPKFHQSENEHSKVFVRELQTHLEEDAIIREAMRGETETEYRTKYQAIWKGFMKNYSGIKEKSVMKIELYGTKLNHSSRQLEKKVDDRTIVHIVSGQFEEEIHNKVIIDETKKFDELVKILKAHDHCERDR
ncbi:hypothetical protein FQA39_LY06128 [Lamprigera yunnana]|nr:hypothetical protein FQA39_LY06128 [Lamprigera yunnana]